MLRPRRIKGSSHLKEEYSAKWDFIKAPKNGEDAHCVVLILALPLVEVMTYRFLMKNTGFGVSE